MLHPRITRERSGRAAEGRLAEAVGLALAISLEVVDAEVVTLSKRRSSTLLGKGRVDELAGRIAADSIEIAIIDSPLTPVQQRNLEKAWHCKVIDRTGLILEIFGDRARTREGSLQVELAALSYQRSRLVRSWTHLERQRGGDAPRGTVAGSTRGQPVLLPAGVAVRRLPHRGRGNVCAGGIGHDREPALHADWVGGHGSEQDRLHGDEGTASQEGSPPGRGRVHAHRGTGEARITHQGWGRT